MGVSDITVSQLIEALSKLPQDLPAVDTYGDDIETVIVAHDYSSKYHDDDVVLIE